MNEYSSGDQLTASVVSRPERVREARHDCVEASSGDLANHQSSTNTPLEQLLHSMESRRQIGNSTYAASTFSHLFLNGVPVVTS